MKSYSGWLAIAGSLVCLVGPAAAAAGMYHPFPLEAPYGTYVIDYHSHHAPLQQVTVTGDRITVVYRSASSSPYGQDLTLDLTTGGMTVVLRSYSGSVVEDRVPAPEIGQRFFAYLNALEVMRAYVKEIEKNGHPALSGLILFLDQATRLAKDRNLPEVREISVNTPAEFYHASLSIPVLRNDFKRLGYAESFGGRYKLAAPAIAILELLDSTQVYASQQLSLPAGYGEVQQPLQLPVELKDPASARFSIRLLSKDTTAGQLLAQATYAITQLLPPYAVAPHTYRDDQGKPTWPAVGKAFWVELSYSTLKPAQLAYEIRDQAGSVLYRTTAPADPNKQGTALIPIPVLPVESGKFYPVTITLTAEGNPAELLATWDSDIFYP